MPSLSTIVHWLNTHALSIAIYLSLAAGLLRALYAMLARILAPYPRARAFVEAVAAMAPDVLRFIGQVYALLTGRALPSTGTLPPAEALPASPPPVALPPLSVVTYHPPSFGPLAPPVATAPQGSRAGVPPREPTDDEVHALARRSVRADLGSLMPPAPDAEKP